MNNRLVGMAGPTDNMTKGLRSKLAGILRWTARGLSLLAGGLAGLFVITFVMGSFNPGVLPPTASDLFKLACFTACIGGSLAAWRWPRLGGLVGLGSATVLATDFIGNALRSGPEILETIFSVVVFCGPFIFIGILFITEGILNAKESEAAMSTPLAKTDSLTIRQTLQRLALLAVPVLMLIGVSGLWANRYWRPFAQGELFTHTIYSYRQWQSTGYYLNPGDRVFIRANGQWMYSPVVGWHSPDGGEPAPSYYPMPSARGGALIGKIGEDGQAFVVGWYHELTAREPGLLYLRINDDKLGDNQGELNLSIQIVGPTATP